MICLGVVIAVIKIAQQFELEFVGVAFDRLQPRVHLARGREVGAFAQFLDHRQHRFGGLIEQFEMLLETVPVKSSGQIRMRSPIFSTVFGIL